MILSFHPCYEGDENRLCAGRDPGPEDRAAMERASAVILPQGCRASLYRMATRCCPHVFPDYAVRFAFPGKTGQIRLFRRMGVSHPESEVFSGAKAFFQKYGTRPKGFLFSFPVVFKRDWGGEGEGVFYVEDPDTLKALVMREGQRSNHEVPFVIQEYIPAGNRSLRVVVIGDSLYSYWRCQVHPGRFLTNLAADAVIDAESDPRLQRMGREAVRDFCNKTGVNLAGLDLLMHGKGSAAPVFLEINYFFGRKGLGGSLRYYTLLTQAINRWLSELGLKSHA